MNLLSIITKPTSEKLETLLKLSKKSCLKNPNTYNVCQLSKVQQDVTQKKGTEKEYSGELYYENRPGIYLCVVCKTALFSSKSKFTSKCGWPAFCDVINMENFHFVKDTSYGMIRVEVVCNKCNSHLGHVFDDGPKPSGLRYCINSASLEFQSD